MESVDREKINTHFKKKEIIFHENEKIRGFYCIKSGLARIYKTTNTGKEQTFQIASRGKWLGFRDVISGLEYNHTAVCLEDSELCYISEETTKRLIKSDGMFQIEVLKYLAEEWKGIENHVHSMGTKQVHSRLAELLILFHNASDKDAEVSINVTREVMASCIGTTKETIIRSLSDFKDRNWIKVEKNNIKIVNPKALYTLAEANEE
ncbi:MAG: Crp/Fnr family transcriptional regulator [Leptospiraceae bacterium]|nr:Crp/Fnr family transcriptional regulator [Leptospiraceae bacterium]